MRNRGGPFLRRRVAFQRDLKVLKIPDVVVTSHLTAEVVAGLNETSPYHHRPALAKPVPTPSVDELREFLARLENFCGALKQQKKGLAEKPVLA